ncbi:hypothetical protein OH492_13040 [Vibrio chagasii]|nr:hypothetical protein [Vibrio chagasii]
MNLTQIMSLTNTFLHTLLPMTPNIMTTVTAWCLMAVRTWQNSAISTYLIGANTKCFPNRWHSFEGNACTSKERSATSRSRMPSVGVILESSLMQMV